MMLMKSLAPRACPT